MKKLLGAVSLLCVAASPVFAQGRKASTASRVKGPSVAEAVQRVEREWVDAVKAGNLQQVSAVLADDWVGLGFGAGRETKQGFLEGVKSHRDTLESFEFGPMDVKVLGNVAVVQGSDVEKSTNNGKDSSGKYVWMDVFVKRGGRWVAIRSQDAKVD